MSKTNVRAHIRRKTHGKTIVRHHRRRIHRRLHSRPVRPIIKMIDEELFREARKKYGHNNYPSGGESARVARLDVTDDVGITGFYEEPQSRVNERNWMIKRLNDFKKWAKEKNLKNDDVITEFDGERGFGVFGFDGSPGGPMVSWDNTIGNYIRQSEDEIKGRLKLISDVESQKAGAAITRFGKFKPLVEGTVRTIKE